MPSSSTRDSVSVRPAPTAAREWIATTVRALSATAARRPASPDRGQASPLAALAALFAVCAGLSLYAATLGASIPVVDDRDLAEPTIERVHDAASDGVVVAPERLADAIDRGPDGRLLNASLVVDGREWAVGPTVPSTATDRATRLVSVRRGPGRVDPGRLRVVVWS